MTFASANNISNMRNGETAKHGDDSKLFVEFYTDKILLTQQTDDNGEPVYREVEMISIKIPGDAKTVVQKEVEQKDKTRFHQQYSDFKSGREQIQSGHDLKLMDLGRSELVKLNYMNIVTIEQLAELPDFLLDDVGLGARGLRSGAQKWLENKAKSDSDVGDLRAQNTQLAEQLLELQKQVSDLMKKK